MSGAKLVHAHVYNPAAPGIFKAKASEPASFHTVSCSASERCSLFAKGQCAARQFLGNGCVYGQATVQRGPSKRARGFYDWIRARKEESAKVGQLAAPPTRLAAVGDYIWLPYAHMNAVIRGETRFFEASHAVFLPIAEFTAAKIAFLCNGRPQAIMGGEIRAYQQESVPLFIAHLSESYPDLLREAAALSPRIRAVLATLTKVGRKARLRTLRPNVGTFEGWTWDGSHLTSRIRTSFPPFTKFGAREVRILPSEDAVVVITDDAQVTADTVFED